MTSTIEVPGYADLLDLPQIKSADACRAIGCNADWLKNMVSRVPPVVLLKDDERVNVGGRQYLALSFRSVAHLALVRRLSAFFTPREAHGFAAGFTYFGDTAARPDEQSRGPGELYAQGRTFLFANPQSNTGVVIPRDATTTAVDFTHAGTQGRGLGSPVAIIDVSEVVWQVRATLGMGR